MVIYLGFNLNTSYNIIIIIVFVIKPMINYHYIITNIVIKICSLKILIIFNILVNYFTKC
jgi:hypothetical protein